MTHRVRSAFGRFLALAVGLGLAVSFAVTPLAAQQTTGKIEGTVTDQAGVAIANAQVFIVGTSFGAVTNDKGYYFINNVPVGSYAIRAQFIGYAPSEVRDARVLGGQTVTFNLKMQSSAVQVTGITVTAAANPIVPRDQVTSKTIISGALVQNLPIDDVRNVITLQPGVVESGSGAGVAIRGGRPGEANVYIDGTPVRSTNSGAQAITVGTNAVKEASVTTGALGVQFGDAQAGVISYTTKSGTSQLQGTLTGQTDGPFGNSISNGFNRFEGSLGGPIPGTSNLRFFLSSIVQGIQSSDLASNANTTRIGQGWENVPTYIVDGVDSTLTFADTSGNPVTYAAPRFVQYSGQCDASKNYGIDCHGRRFPMNWQTQAQASGKLSYSYGNGSSISLSGTASGNQGRNWPGTSIGDPGLFTGWHNWDRLGVLNWTHSFFKSSERELALNVNLSYATDHQIIGLIDPASDQSTRDPSLGLEFNSLTFPSLGGMPFPIDDQLIRNIRTNTGLRTPYLNQTQLRNAQPYRANPYP